MFDLMNLRIDMLTLAEASVGPPLFWSLVLIVILLVLFGAVAMYRRWMNADDVSGGEGFTLSDLRRLHKSGQMTDEEFEKAKRILIGSVKAAAEKMGEKAKEGPRTVESDLDQNKLM
jgi:hypothetical protein